MALIKSFQFLRDEADRAFEREFITKSDEAQQDTEETFQDLKKDEAKTYSEQKNFVKKVKSEQAISAKKEDEQTAQIQPGKYKLPDGSWVTLGKPVNVSKKQNLGFDPSILDDLQAQVRNNDVNLRRIGIDVNDTKKEITQLRKNIQGQKEYEVKNTESLIDYQKTEAPKNLEKINKDIEKRNKERQDSKSDVNEKLDNIQAELKKKNSTEKSKVAKTSPDNKITENPYDSFEHDIDEDKEKVLGYDKANKLSELTANINKLKQYSASVKKHGVIGAFTRGQKLKGINFARKFIQQRQEKQEAKQRLFEHGNLSPIEKLTIDPMAFLKEKIMGQPERNPDNTQHIDLATDRAQRKQGLQPLEIKPNRAQVKSQNVLGEKKSKSKPRSGATTSSMSSMDRGNTFSRAEEKASVGNLMKGGKSRSMLAKSGSQIGKTKGALKGVTSSISKAGSKAAGKSLLKKIPFVGALVGLASGVGRLLQGDILGAGMEVASGFTSLVPGGQAVGIGIDAALAARDTVRARDAAAKEEEEARKGEKKFAKGGIITQPTKLTAPDFIGEMGEKGPEAIVPITNQGQVKADSNVKITAPENKEEKKEKDSDKDNSKKSLKDKNDKIQPVIVNNVASSTATSSKKSAKQEFGGRLSEDLFIFNDVNIQR